ncbi:MAG: 2-C-methyl-D-erythritol 4-phosphate cytidylyltransferase [Methanobrevibacter sp.]|jgi:2-C-methyl-D-erythritol 4-phosphate cytidylyltransferase|nr:2-C-methyl-D-erythritol 4-phosphate cytidylyltransferase [Candidatus Methanovirga aequatorialis]
MIYAQIMAAGVGKRMGNTKLPKQFLTLGGKPILIHTIEKFTLHNDFEKIIVSAPNEWIDYTLDIIAKHELEDERIKVIEGRKERNDTLYSAIDFIEKEYGIMNDDVLLVHDAVRPFVTKKIINDNIKMSKDYLCVNTVIPAIDTIIRGFNNEVVEIPVRDFMYQGQTPQTFNINALKKSFNLLTNEEKKSLSESCKIMHLKGYKVKMVNGDALNIKITTQHDLRIANAIIEEEYWKEN